MEARCRVPASKNILVIDDNADMVQLLEDVLHLAGYRVLTAASTREAVDVIERLNADPLDLVITDINLTGDREACEGYALYQCWTRAYPGLPFLLISGDAGSLDLPDIRDSIVPFLAKPFAVEAFLDAVEALLKQQDPSCLRASSRVATTAA